MGRNIREETSDEVSISTQSNEKALQSSEWQLQTGEKWTLAKGQEIESVS